MNLVLTSSLKCDDIVLTCDFPLKLKIYKTYKEFNLFLLDLSVTKNKIIFPSPSLGFDFRFI